MKCGLGHENSEDAVFCSQCGERIVEAKQSEAQNPKIEPSVVSASQHPDSAAAATSDSTGNNKLPDAKPKRIRRKFIVLAAVCLVVLALGALVTVKLVTKSQQDAAWKKISTAKYMYATLEDDGSSLTFESPAKSKCDISDYYTWDYYLGRTTDWDSYNTCNDQADAAFDLDVMNTRSELDDFTKDVGIPESFGKRLGKLRGLDGTETADFNTAKVGKVHLSYGFDGSNGMYVQIEKQPSKLWSLN